MSMMKNENIRQQILQIIRNNNEIGKTKIAKISKLSLPTVMKVTDELIQMGFVREVRKGESTGGKRPMLVEFVDDSYFSVGVDVGATNIYCVMMNASRVVSRDYIPTDFKDGPEKVMERIGDLIEKVIAKEKVDMSRFIGIGIAVPGLIDANTKKVIFSPDIGWQSIDVSTPFNDRFSQNVYIENSTRAMAFGEKLYGIAREINNYMCINLGYGIGGALVFENEVYTGQSGTAGEFGHITVVPKGPICDCGNRGCLEAVSSGRAIARDAKQQLIAGKNSIMHDMVKNNYDLIEAKTVFDAAKAGDDLALDIVLNAIENLGTAIAGIINLLDLEMIILEGRMSSSGDILTNNLQRAVEAHKMPYAGSECQIVVSNLGIESTAIGAASIVINKLLQSGGNLQLT